MEIESGHWLLLLLGPAGAVGVYWGLWEYYRNTGKSHGYEHETQVELQPVQASDRKVDEVRGTQERRIRGDNASLHRQRVRRLGPER